MNAKTPKQDGSIWLMHLGFGLICVALIGCSSTRVIRTDFGLWKTEKIPELGISVEIPEKQYRFSCYGFTRTCVINVYAMRKSMTGGTVPGIAYINCHPIIPMISFDSIKYEFVVTITRCSSEVYDEAEKEWSRRHEDSFGKNDVNEYDKNLFNNYKLYKTPGINRNGRFNAINYYMKKKYRALNGDIIEVSGGFDVDSKTQKNKETDLAALAKIIDSIKIYKEPPLISEK